MYKNDLEEHLKSVIAEQKPQTYEELFKLSKGAFPDVVYTIINNTTNFPISIKTNDSLDNISSEDLPEPNPQNYDWRFDVKTVNKLVDLLKEKNFKRIALFGTPSLFTPISRFTSDVILFDVNEVLPKYFNNDSRIVIADLNTNNLAEFNSFDCIIMDPPWYLSYYESWIQKGNTLLNFGGEMLITLFQSLLRPNAKKEISKIKKKVKSIGSIEVIENYIAYTTPVFENEVLKELNIPCLGDWRIADLLIVKKENDSIIKQLNNIQKDNWTRISLNNHVIAIENTNAISEITVSFPYDGDDSLLKSVSNRDSKRKKLNFITSRNRGLHITGNEKVIQILRGLSMGIESSVLIRQLNLNQKESIQVNKILTVLSQ